MIKPCKEGEGLVSNAAVNTGIPGKTARNKHDLTHSRLRVPRDIVLRNLIIT